MPTDGLIPFEGTVMVMYWISTLEFDLLFNSTFFSARGVVDLGSILVLCGSGAVDPTTRETIGTCAVGDHSQKY